MEFDQIRRRGWLSVSLVALLGVLGLVMAVLQYRWTGELSRAEEQRLRFALDQSLDRLRDDLNRELAETLRTLQPSAAEFDAQPAEAAYAARYARWKAQNSDDQLIEAMGLAVPEQGEAAFRRFDPGTGTFAAAAWPEKWAGLRDQLAARVRGERVAPDGDSRSPLLVELPHFGPSGARPGPGPGAQFAALAEQDWLIVEFNAAYLRATLLPRLLARHLTPMGAEPYQIDVYAANGESVYRAGLREGETLRGRAQTSVRLLEVSRPMMNRGIGPRGDQRPGGGFGPRLEPGRSPDRSPGRPPEMRRAENGGPRGPSFGDPPRAFGGPSRAFEGPPRPDGERGRGSWEMFVNPPGGSLQALVDRTRWRNLALALTLLVLIVATSLVLVRSARQSQQLAELQMNFVSSVSHELRTPLTVIRTAAFNLRGRVAAKPDQVERYGKLIQEQSEKLGGLVEQVLRYASSRAGQIIHEREAVVIDDVIEGGIRSSQLALETSPYQLEKHIAPGLPLVLADERALQHVVQNLLDNAVKYGTESSNWIGLTVAPAGDFVEIRVADRGPGIPADEQSMIFEPFFRGRRAIADQVHGTGLGLNLVRKIVEAHGGTIRVQNHAPQGSEFIVRLPVAPPEMQDEFAHTAG